jgi:hypothetical protein
MASDSPEEPAFVRCKYPQWAQLMQGCTTLNNMATSSFLFFSCLTDDG